MNRTPCETANTAAEANHSICDISKKNAAMIADLNAGMDTLLEVLVGAGRGCCGDSTRPTPACLLDDITIQSNDLREIHAKLSRVLCSLNG